MSDDHIDWLELGFVTGNEGGEISTSDEHSASVVEGMR
jgi:hypothetical protein